MNQIQSLQPLAESIEPRALTADEVIATVAGGPQVINDAPV
ncbi:hypothetical protein [Roseateles chitosanitabidus]|nr:hypothetical protein [Roseateles chitosanitabidus]